MNIKELFERDGLVVFQSALQADVVASWRLTYDNLHNPERTPEWNPVAVNEDALQPLLRLIATHPMILSVVTQIFGPDIALYNQRFIVKDKHARNSVFLHHDTPYHVGWPNKASVFVPLSRVTQENGGLIFYPGTHKFGYLGDAGEIHPKWLHGFTAVLPELTQGDFVIMHSALWHESRPNLNGIDRIIADVHMQPADDPSGVELLQGEWKTPIRMSPEMRANPLMRSRASRLKELQDRVDSMQIEIEGLNDQIQAQL